jgi:hypothetical protein
MVSNGTLETLIWLLIYGGLLTLCLGVFVHRSSAVPEWVLLLLGGTAVSLGVVLVWVRSRRPR